MQALLPSISFSLIQKAGTFLFMMCFGIMTTTQAQIYVDVDASGADDGSSWADAYVSLQDALEAATGSDQIWIADGAYYPDEGENETQGDRSASFYIPGTKDGLKIYGGFSGSESSLEQRDLSTHKTILSGDIEGNHDGDLAGNSYHVVYFDGAYNQAPTADFAGELISTYEASFTNQSVDPDGTIDSYHWDFGDGNSATSENPDHTYGSTGEYTVTLTVTDNEGATDDISATVLIESSGSGGIGEFRKSASISVSGSVITNATLLSDVTITGGNASESADDGHGAGVFCDGEGADNECSPTLQNVIIANNRSSFFASGMFNDGQNGKANPRLVNVLFVGNQSGSNGGAIYNYGRGGEASPTIINSSFVNNESASSGGGIINYSHTDGVAKPTIINSIFYGNVADSDGNGSGGGDQIANSGDSAVTTISYSLIEGGAAEVTSNASFLNTDGGVTSFQNSTNISGNPAFTDILDPDGADDIFGTADDGLKLQAHSPAIDAGVSDTSGLQINEIGFSGGERFIGSSLDMGAYESPLTLKISGNEGWRMLSSPYENTSYGALLDSLWTQGFTGADSETGDVSVFYYDESESGFSALSSASEIPENGAGFITYVYDDDDYDGNGDGFPKGIQIDETERTGSISPSLSFTDSGTLADDGWNLVGNPYSKTIDWDASGWTTSNLDATIYVWNAEASEYQSWNGGSGTLSTEGLITPFQGFWVKANGASPELTFTEDIRSAGGIFYKESPISELRFTISDGNMANQAVVMMDEQASISKDKMDAYKLAPLNADRLSIFTQLENGEALDINALPAEMEESISIPLDIDRGGAIASQEKFELSWESKALPEDRQFTLVDNETGAQVDLSKVSSLSVELESSEPSKTVKAQNISSPRHTVLSPQVMKSKADVARFTLHITSNQSVPNEGNADFPNKVDLQQNYPNPFNPTTMISYQLPEAGQVDLQVFDMLGREVATLVDNRMQAGSHQVTFNAESLSSGVYLYRLKVGQTIITKKLTLIK